MNQHVHPDKREAPRVAGMFDQVQSTIAKHALAIPVVQTSTAGSDHSAFREVGIPAMGVTEEYVNGDSTPHYHLPSDTYETVDFGFLEFDVASREALFCHREALGGVIHGDDVVESRGQRLCEVTIAAPCIQHSPSAGEKRRE